MAQALWQLAALGATLAVALLGGALAGFIVSRASPAGQCLGEEDLFEDAAFWCGAGASPRRLACCGTPPPVSMLPAALAGLLTGCAAQLLRQGKPCSGHVAGSGRPCAPITILTTLTRTARHGRLSSRASRSTARAGTRWSTRRRREGWTMWRMRDPAALDDVAHACPSAAQPAWWRAWRPALGLVLCAGSCR